jgi:hypothetical protein
MTTTPGPRPAPLARAVVVAALPAYALPAVQVFVTSRLLGDDRLATAAFTSIAVPSAVAAALVTVVLHGRTPAVRPAAALTTVLAAALGCATIALAVAASLGGTGLADSTLLLDAVPSAAVGGTVTAAVRVRSARHRSRRRRAGGRCPAPAACPASAPLVATAGRGAR